MTITLAQRMRVKCLGFKLKRKKLKKFKKGIDRGMKR